MASRCADPGSRDCYRNRSRWIVATALVIAVIALSACGTSVRHQPRPLGKVAGSAPLPGLGNPAAVDPTLGLDRPQGSIRHGRQRVHVELHIGDISGSEGDRRQGVLRPHTRRARLDLGECYNDRRKRPGPWDDQRNDHPPPLEVIVAHRLSGGGSATSSAAGVVPFQRGAPTTTSKQVVQIPANYTEGRERSSAERQRLRRRKLRWPSYPGGVVDRVGKAEQR